MKKQFEEPMISVMVFEIGDILTLSAPMEIDEWGYGYGDDVISD